MIARLLAAFGAGISPLLAQSTRGGTVEGRVLNTRNGEYLEKARVTVEGTSFETFTDTAGQYRIVGVPAGEARVRVFHTGLVPQTRTITVAAGQTGQLDFNLADSDAKTAPDQTVKLDQFVVSTSKEMDGAAIAINEQRFASNIMNVVAADEFGIVAEGNVGEFLKFLPGITIDYGGGDARTISMNGVPSSNVPVTVGGFNLASAASSGTGRTVELEQVSINNISRIEVSYSPTPESTGSALAGSVNMVPRSAFERSRPVLNYNAYVMMRDNDRTLRRAPGPREGYTYHAHPGFDFSYIVPVNKRFGFTLSAGYTKQYTPQDFMSNTWRGVTSAASANNANGTPGNLPIPAPGTPYLSDYAVRDGTKDTARSSVGATIDYKLSRNDRVSFSFQWAFFDASFNNRSLTFIVNRVLPGQYSSRFTHGFAGAGEIRISTGARQKAGTTYMPAITYRHDGPIWKAESGLGYSHASNHYRDIDKGYFNATLARRTNVTVSFDDIFYLRPERITVTDGTTGAPVDPNRIATYALNTANGDYRESADAQRTGFANLRRDFSLGVVPLSLKAGVDVRNSMRDIRGGTPPFTFVGADGRTSTNVTVNSDDSAAGVFDDVFSQRIAPYGFGRIQWVSNEKYWQLYKEHPNYFTTDQNSFYRSGIGLSKRAEETIWAGYLRADAQFFQRRLKLVGGLRAEQTNIKAEGPLTDPTRNFQRDANGNFIRGSNGRPLTITSDALRMSQLTYLDRGTHVEKEYLRLFPSINASCNVRENLIARGAYYWSVGRPDFNQYSGGLTLPDSELVPSAGNRITVNNAGIKAWKAQTYKFTLEHYFERVGLFSVGVYRRDFENFFGSTVFGATPEFLALYDLDPDVYDRYDVSTQHNIPGTVRMQGVDFNYKQALTFLPNWARGVQVFANGSAQRATGSAADNFSGYIPRSGSWGISLTRPKYTARVNWNYRGRQRRTIVTGTGIEPGTYQWGSKRLYIDVTGEYNLARRIGIFANLRNVGDATEDIKIFGPSTPKHARFRSREDFASLWTFGVKGAF